MSKVPVVLFGDYIAAYGVIRALAPKGIPIYIISRTGSGLATKSRFVRKSFAIPSDEPDFVKQMTSRLHQEGVHEAVLMIAGTDDYLDVLAKHYDELATGLRPTFPNWETVAIVREKQRTLELAEDLGIPVPKTHHIGCEADFQEFMDGEQKLRFPLIFKANQESAAFSKLCGTKSIICHNLDEVSKHYAKLTDFPDTLLLQELIPGGEDLLFNLIVTLNGNSEPTAVFMNKKRRSIRQFLNCTLMESMWSDETLRYGLKFLKAARYVGYANPEFKLDSRDGQLKLIEINGRISMSNSHALRCKINIPIAMYKEALNGSLPPLHNIKQDYPNNILWWHPAEDVSAITGQMKNGDFSPYQYLKSLIGRGYIIEPLYWRDPYPGLLTIGMTLANLLKLFVRQIARVTRQSFCIFKGKS